jgi:hypothetical protein
MLQGRHRLRHITGPLLVWNALPRSPCFSTTSIQSSPPSIELYTSYHLLHLLHPHPLHPSIHKHTHHGVPHPNPNPPPLPPRLNTHITIHPASFPQHRNSAESVFCTRTCCGCTNRVRYLSFPQCPSQICLMLRNEGLTCMDVLLTVLQY